MRFSASSRSRVTSLFPVPLNSSKITSSIRLPVSISAVPTMVSEPASSVARAAPKMRLGRSSARLSTPPVMVRPELSTSLLKARASRVIESSRIITSFPPSTMRRARSSASSATLR